MHILFFILALGTILHKKRHILVAWHRFELIYFRSRTGTAIEKQVSNMPEEFERHMLDIRKIGLLTPAFFFYRSMIIWLAPLHAP